MILTYSINNKYYELVGDDFLMIIATQFNDEKLEDVYIS